MELGLVWNAGIAFFVLFALAGLYANLVGPLPDWVPIVGIENGIPLMNGEPMTLGMTLFLSLFLIPFVAVGLGLAGAGVFSLCGRVRVMISETESWVATGVGPISWRQRFDSTRILDVNVVASRGNRSRLIVLSGDPTIEFGASLPTEPKDWMKAVLKDRLLSPEPSMPESTLADTSD